MKQKTRVIFLCIGFLAFFALAGCDMVRIDEHVPKKTGSREIDDLERDDLEKNGHFLKLVNMPLNTQIPNVFSVSVANSLSSIAKLNKDNYVFIYKEKDVDGNYTSCTVYLPLVYNDDKEFTETGFFYSAFSIHIDALTKYVVDVSDNFIVYYTDGRGQADVNDLPSAPADSKELTEKERSELEKTGRFLKLVNLPLYIQAPNVFSVSVANSSSAIAKLDKNSPVSIFREENSCTVYLPLVYNDDKEFTETGFFFTAFSIHVDALTSFIVNVSDHFIVNFSDGRGQADINDLPSPPSDSRELNEKERAELEISGSYLKIINLPLHTQAPNVFSVSVSNSSSVIAKLDKNSPVSIFREENSSTVYLPLVYNDGNKFAETGFFYSAFSIHVDALTSYIISPSDRFIVSYSDGRGQADAGDLPSPVSEGSRELNEKERGELEKTGRFLKIVNLPPHTQVGNVFSVSVANSSSSIAKLDKNSPVSIFQESNSCTVYLPLVYNDEKEFTETGSFFTSFTIHVDALTSYVVSPSDHFIVSFSDGRGQADADSLPSPLIAGSKELNEVERGELEKTGHFLKLFNMPLNTQVPNVFSLSVANSSSSIAKLDKNSTVFIFRENNSCSVYLPLVYNDEKEFIETGNFFTSFTIHIDALTSYIVNPSDHFIVSFSDGRGQADADNLPLPPEPPVIDPHYLTITNLPSSVSVNKFSDVSVNNQKGPVAKCKDYSQIVLSVTNNKASASIPLHNISSDGYFSETGTFYILFDIIVDVNSRYTLTKDDNVTVAFTDGNGRFDINNMPTVPVPPVVVPHYLTITNLPSSVSIKNFSGVSVENQKGSVAKCNDYSQILLSVSGNKTTAKIPLHYVSSDEYFTETGTFYIIFDIVVDINSRFTLTKNDKVTVAFSNGNGQFDITNMPSSAVPPTPSYLTIIGFPANSVIQQLSNVNVYSFNNTSVASGDINNTVVSTNSNNTKTFKIPLLANGGYFNYTGNYGVSFTLNVDAEKQISYTSNDLMLYFFNGSAEFDISSFFGHFQGALAEDNAAPVVKAGTSIDISGRRKTVTQDVTVFALPTENSCVLYLYAVSADSDVLFDLSSTAPAYDDNKNGYYNGAKRALWKMIYLKNSNLYLFKTKIDDPFPHLGTFVLDNVNDYSQFSSKTSHYSLDGSNDPEATTITLEPGVYVIELKGAAGGGSFVNSPVSVTAGGSGGLIREIITLNKQTKFTAFTGSAGFTAQNIITKTGTFNIITTKNYYTYTKSTSGSGPSSRTNIDSSTLNTSTVISAVTTSDPDKKLLGGAGGGGGSGTFLYHFTSDYEKYFLLAGGGSGASGHSYLIPGGAGGAGGTIGPGAGGGGSGSFSLSSSAGTGGDFNTSGVPGGKGGGSLGGAAGDSAKDGANALSAGVSGIISDMSVSGGISAATYLSDFSAYLSPKIPFLYVSSGYAASSQGFTHTKTTNPVFTVRTTISGKSSSGNGGSAAAISSGWLKTTDAAAKGADAPKLNDFSVSAAAFTITGSLNDMPGADGSSWNNTFNANPPFTAITFTIGAVNPGVKGNDGGNNRNSSKGGAEGGISGSITIHKIY